MSPWFHESAQPGDTIEVRGPIGGHFVWRGDDGGPLLLIGGGSGIVPLMAIARHRANVAPATPALLVYSARTWDDIVYRDELVAMAARDPAFRLVLATTREPRRRAQDLDRRIDDAALRDVVSRWGHAPRHVYACGSNAFVGAVTASIVRDGVPAERVRAERYGGVAYAELGGPHPALSRKRARERKSRRRAAPRAGEGAQSAAARCAWPCAYVAARAAAISDCRYSRTVCSSAASSGERSSLR